MKPKRYENLTKIIKNKHYHSIMEIGVLKGKHAYQMIKAAMSACSCSKKKIEYYGFDLFEGATKEILKKEFSKLNPSSCKNTQEYLEKTGATIHLFKGYSKDTLPKFVVWAKNKNKKIDFVFIDGGHLIETITSDWNYVKGIISPNSTVVFDDYFNNNENEVKKFGCNVIIDNLDRNKYNVEILKPEDHFPKGWGMLRIRMVKVSLKK